MFYEKLVEVLDISKKELQINEQIRDAQIRVIDANGSQIGVIPTADAMKKAIQSGLDLVKIADANSKSNSPAVCKIMDYGKYKYELSKKEKESRKKQHSMDIKEVRLSMNIEENDLKTKVNHARRFAESGDKIKVSMRLRGREMGHSELGKDLMLKFSNLCSEFADLQGSVSFEGRSLSMLLTPKSSKSQAAKKTQRKVVNEGAEKSE